MRNRDRHGEPVQLTGAVDAETELAYLFNDGIRRVWLAKVHATWDPDESLMAMPEWFAIEKELV